MCEACDFQDEILTGLNGYIKTLWKINRYIPISFIHKKYIKMIKIRNEFFFMMRVVQKTRHKELFING